MDFKDPQVQKSIIVGILLLIVGYVYFFTAFMPFFFGPQQAKIVDGVRVVGPGGVKQLLLEIEEPATPRSANLQEFLQADA